MQDEGDDPTVPTGRAGVDPLLAYPRESTGQTGKIERPGDQTPWWFIPGLFAVAVFFIGLLSLISQDREADRLEAQNAADAQAATEQAAAAQAEAAEQAAAADDPGADQPAISVADTEPAPADTVVADDSGLPPAGTLRLGNDQFAITASCEVQLPFDPANVTVQVSSYAFFDGDGVLGLVDRVVDGEADRASIFRSGAVFEQLEAIGDDGAFSARFEGGLEVLVNPSSGPSQCNDSLITNAPGQFTEPFTRTILDICVDGETTVGLASLGGRFEVSENADGSADMVLQDPEGGLRRVSTEATVLRSDDTLSASGVVGDGDAAIDISIDIGFSLDLGAARECAPSERL